MNSPFNIGDLVVLKGKGCDQPAAELMAIWTIEQLTSTHAIVVVEHENQIAQIDDLPRKRYPLNWLALYRRESKDAT